MRFNIKKLESKGFVVYVDKDSIEINAPALTGTDWEAARNIIQQMGVKDPALQNYVMEAYLTALQRAQVLELAE